MGAVIAALYTFRQEKQATVAGKCGPAVHIGNLVHTVADQIVFVHNFIHISALLFVHMVPFSVLK